LNSKYYTKQKKRARAFSNNIKGVAEMTNSRSLHVSSLVISKYFPIEAHTMHLICKSNPKILLEKVNFNVK
jgi:hypothetical protein